MKSKHRRRRGNAALEFALTWAACSVMFTGIFQYGWSMFIYNQLQTSVANGATYAATANFSASDTTAFTDAVKNIVVYGQTTTGTSPLVSGLTTSNVNVNLNLSGGYPTDVTVSISSFSVNAVFGTQTFTGKPRVTMQYMGLATP